MKKINGYIKNYDEAVLIMHAARLGTLTPATERLNAEEREHIESGNIFCFIEDDNGMKRWTDGRIWSPSKICGEFLIYQEVPRHLSKNSIKKRKELEKSLENSDSYINKSREDYLDRTTMHKKTVSIKHGNLTYHIIAYYRPVFVNCSILDLEYFKKLAAALVLFPLLTKDEYVKKHIDNPGFFKEHELDSHIAWPILETEKRNALEGIAVEVLLSLGRRAQRETN